MPTAVGPDVAGLLPAFQALSDENRLRIVDALRDGERCVCVLQDVIGLSQSLLSHHLRVLREAGLVVDRREGRWVHYSLEAATLEGVEAFVRGVRGDAVTCAAPGAAGGGASGTACCP